MLLGRCQVERGYILKYHTLLHVCRFRNADWCCSSEKLAACVLTILIIIIKKKFGTNGTFYSTEENVI